jgi:ABC-2 type transport system ATP-binding protein
VKSLKKKYKNFSLKDVSFSLEKGTITGFIGENGAGKTTIFSSILNLIQVDAGEVLLNGKRIRNKKDIARISYLECNRELYPNVKGYEYKNFIRDVYKKRWSEERYQEYLKKFCIVDDYKISDFSTGMREKFFLAVELAKQPELIILDEPTSGLDPIARTELLKMIRNLVDEDQVTILFSSHITSDIENIADNVIFIDDGEILLDMNKKKIQDQYKEASLDDVLMYLTGGKKIV